MQLEPRLGRAARPHRDPSRGHATRAVKARITPAGEQLSRAHDDATTCRHHPAPRRASARERPRPRAEQTAISHRYLHRAHKCGICSRVAAERTDCSRPAFLWPFGLARLSTNVAHGSLSSSLQRPSLRSASGRPRPQTVQLGAQIDSMPRAQRAPSRRPQSRSRGGLRVRTDWPQTPHRCSERESDLPSGRGRSDHSASSWIARVRPMSSTECRRMLFKCSIALYMTAQLERAQRHLP